MTQASKLWSPPFVLFAASTLLTLAVACGDDKDSGAGGASPAKNTSTTITNQGGGTSQGGGGAAQGGGGAGGGGGTAQGGGGAGGGGGSTLPPSGSDYCSEYYPAGHPARSAPGFSVPTTILEPVIRQFEEVFASGSGLGPPITLLDVIDNGQDGRGAFAGPHGGPGKYMSIPIDIPASTPAGTGFSLQIIEPQKYQGMDHSLLFEANISPCQGDFRARAINNASSDYYDRSQCRTTGTSLYATTGNLVGPGNYCFLKPGARMYINVTNHSLDAYRATGAPPVWGCDAGVTNCGKKVDVRRRTGG